MCYRASSLRRQAGVQASARMARRVFVWLPAYARTEVAWSLGKFKARGLRGDVLPSFVAPAPGRSPGLCAHGAPCFCLDPGLRRDDDVVESRQIQSARLSWRCATELRRSGARPESRPLRACAPCFCLDPGLRRDDDVVESRQIQSARLFRGDVLPTFVAPAPGRSPCAREGITSARCKSASRQAMTS